MTQLHDIFVRAYAVEAGREAKPRRKSSRASGLTTARRASWT